MRIHPTTMFHALCVAVVTLLLAGPAARADNVLLVVPNAGSPSAEDLARESAFGSAGFDTTMISASASQAEFNAAVALVNLAYVCEDIASADLNTKLKNVTVGVIIEESALYDEFGFSSSYGSYSSTQIDITNNSHLITGSYPFGLRTICTSAQEFMTLAGTIGGGVTTLAEQPASANKVLTVIERGGALYGGGTAAGRRVALPWGGNSFAFGSLNSSGLLMMYAAMVWASEPAALYSDASAALGFTGTVTTAEGDGAGWHWLDINGDAYLDALCSGSSARIWINSSGTSFFGAASGYAVRGMATPDLNNDGLIDVWITCAASAYDTEMWARNNGSGGFTYPGNLGFSQPSNNEGMAAADIDGDGDVDIVMFSENGNWIGFNDGAATPALTATNNAAYGLNDAGDAGNGDYVSSIDVNGDGYLDFFYHYGTGKLFLSDGDGTYTENASGISVVTGNALKIGSAWGDYDNDGDPDLFVPRYDAAQRGYLWRNNGNGTFTDVTVAMGITSTAQQRSACWGDYDNDGDLDLYITTISGNNLFYRNTGAYFIAPSAESVGASGNSHDAVFVDFDNDGDLDLSVSRQSASCVMFRNSLNDDRYLKVRLIGQGAGGTDIAAIGTKVELRNASDLSLVAVRWVALQRGYGGEEPHWLHFGGLEPSASYVARVYFRSGTVDEPVVPATVTTTIGATTIPQMLTVVEGAGDGYRVTSWREVDPASEN